MKVYLLFNWDNIVIGVYTSYKLAQAHMDDNWDEIVEVVTDTDLTHILAYPELKEGAKKR